MRRLDPVWGTENTARLANADTHHYTNSCPQVHSFNDATWGDLARDLFLPVQSFKSQIPCMKV